MPFIYPWSFCCCRRNFSTFLSLSLSFPFDLLRVCYILFAFELSFLKSAHCCSLIDNDLAINFMFVSSHLRAVCVSVCSLLFDHFFPKPIESLIRFIIIIITLHLQLILPRYYYFYVSFFSRTLSPLAFSLSFSQYIIDILFFVIFWGNFFICCGRKRMNLSSRDQQQQHSSCNDMNAFQIMSHIYCVPLCVCALLLSIRSIGIIYWVINLPLKCIRFFFSHSGFLILIQVYLCRFLWERGRERANEINYKIHKICGICSITHINKQKKSIGYLELIYLCFC